MSYPVVPNTFQNSTTADATQVNANFTALVNGITDGSKDLNAYKITANGTLVAANTLSASTAQIGTVIASGLSANTGYFAVGIMGSALASALSANSVFANNLTVNNSFESNVTVSALSAYSINVNNLTVSTLTPSNIVTSSLSANSIYAANLTIGSGTALSFFSETSGTLTDNLQVSSHFSGTYYGQTFGNLKTIVLNYLGAITMTATQYCYLIARNIATGLVQTSLSNSPLAVPVAVNAFGSVVIYDGVFQYNTAANTYTLTMGNPGPFNSGVSFVFPGLAVKFV